MKKIETLLLTIILGFTGILACTHDFVITNEVHGTVSYRDRDIKGVTVTVTPDHNKYTFKTTSDESGYYFFRGLPDGTYTLSCSYNGKPVSSYLQHYEKTPDPSSMTLVHDGMYNIHVRNIIIPDTEDLGGDEPEEPEDDDYTLPEAEIPILAWHSIPGNEATLENYQDLKDCGFTLSFSQTSTLDEAIAALDLAEQVGIKVITPCPEYDFADFIEAVKDKPALYGYFLKDEPNTEELEDLGTWADGVLDVDSEHAIYFNLYPNYVDEATLGSTYEEYVKQSVQKVKSSQVSFDFYPIRETDAAETEVADSWWRNLEIIRNYSNEADLPFWAFALATAHKPYPIPEMSHLRLQMYTNLAYGAQCLQYFTYWCPKPTDKWDFHDAPIEENGTRTDTWDLVKEMNEELQARAGVFVGCKVLGVYQTGNTIPTDTSMLTGYNPPIKTLDTGGHGAVVSFLENGNWGYVVFVNRSEKEEFNYTFTFEKDVQIVYRDGTIEDIGNSYSETLGAGDCAIFRWKKATD